MQQQNEMLNNHEQVHNPNAIEQIIEQYLITPQKVVEQISNWEAKLLITLYGKKNTKIDAIPISEKPSLFLVIEKHIQNKHTFVVDDARIITYIMLISNTPANTIIYLWHLQYMCHKLKIKHVNLNNYVEKIMPKGKFNQQVLHETWQAQKITSPPSSYFNTDNLFDYKDAGKSILEIL